jgi:hypothetical protein
MLEAMAEEGVMTTDTNTQRPLNNRDLVKKEGTEADLELVRTIRSRISSTAQAAEFEQLARALKIVRGG